MNKEKKNGKKKLVTTMAVALILLVGITISYGYIAILGNSKNQEVSVGTGDIHLVFDDADTSNVNATLKLGESITKTFKIENKGTKPGKVQINWKNLINTYNSRSLSYTLETSNNKTSGYTRVETIRENVPVSTEAKEVPLSKEITVPVQSAPIYYKVTITVNNLSDVDQSGDLKATLSTEFSLSEVNSLSKKVIAVLDGNVKTNDPELSGPAPRYVTMAIKERQLEKTISSNVFETRYIYYADDYKITSNGTFDLINPKVAKYQDVYSSLNGKYICRETLVPSLFVDDHSPEKVCSSFKPLYQMESASTDSYTLSKLTLRVKHKESEDFILYDPYPLSDYLSSTDTNVIYSDSYTFNGIEFELTNPTTCKYSECYSNLIGKYAMDIDNFSTSRGDGIAKIESATLDTIQFSAKYWSDGDGIVDNSFDGVYAMDDDYGTSYIYRGDIKNNYVKFANRYWKILRVNGDGSIRMILTDKDDIAGAGNFINNSENIAFNEKTDDIKYSGYMFGGSTEDAPSISTDDAFENKYSSNAKKALDTWYENNLASYSNYISDTLFCNDREIKDGSTNFKSYDRLAAAKRTPILKCTQQNDRFTVDDEKVGNGDLTYPIGIVSADELAIAGLMVQSTDYPAEDNYLHNHRWMLTMTPNSVSNPGAMWITGVNWVSLMAYANGTAAYVAPVINIKPEFALKMVGNGTQIDPFIIPNIG